MVVDSLPVVPYMSRGSFHRTVSLPMIVAQPIPVFNNLTRTHTSPSLAAITHPSWMFPCLNQALLLGVRNPVKRVFIGRRGRGDGCMHTLKHNRRAVRCIVWLFALMESHREERRVEQEERRSRDEEQEEEEERRGELGGEKRSWRW